MSQKRPASQNRGSPLSDEERIALKVLVDSLGERNVIIRFGVTRHTLARALGGLGLYPSTLFMIRQRLGATAEGALAPQSTPNP